MADANSALVQMQKLANQTQVQLQQMVNSSNELQTKYNAAEAQKARDWQTNMSKTSHQMEVQDLKKAGLNPVLSAGGSGAQSYTTSSASAQPESGASALAGVQSAQLSSIGNMESSRISAAATRAAAAQSAAAMRAAAAASAAATKYAANVDYAKAKYAADISRKNVITKARTEKWIAINKPTSIGGLLDKYLTKTGIGSAGSSLIRSVVKRGESAFKSIIKNSSGFSNTGKITESNFKLNQSGIKTVNTFLKNNGIIVSERNRRLATQAFVFKNQSAFNSLANMARTKGSKKILHHSR